MSNRIGIPDIAKPRKLIQQRCHDYPHDSSLGIGSIGKHDSSCEYTHNDDVWYIVSKKATTYWECIQVQRQVENVILSIHKAGIYNSSTSIAIFSTPLAHVQLRPSHLTWIAWDSFSCCWTKSAVKDFHALLWSSFSQENVQKQMIKELKRHGNIALSRAGKIYLPWTNVVIKKL